MRASSATRPSAANVAVVIPAYRAAGSIAGVLDQIGPEVSRIYVIDDCCPDGAGRAALQGSQDRRVVVLRNKTNRGVGGSVKRGYRRALRDGAEIVVKLDADGQMNPSHIPLLLAPLIARKADYAKGNRFAHPSLMPEGRQGRMPLRRLAANTALSVLHRGATGYWRIADPANGFTAIRSDALRRLDIEAVEDCYFFETDMLFRLKLIGATVSEIPLPAIYGGVPSSLSLRRVFGRFSRLIVSRYLQRLGLGRRTSAQLSATTAAAIP